MVRRATPDHAEEIHRLMLEAFSPFRDQYTEGCFDATVLDPARIRHRMTEGPAWIAGRDGIGGTVSAVLDARGLYIRGMAVHPDARRQGIGRALLAAAQDHARAIDAPCLWLSTTRFLQGSIALYRAFGFVDAAGPADLHGTPLRSFEKPLQ